MSLVRVGVSHRRAFFVGVLGLVALGCAGGLLPVGAVEGAVAVDGRPVGGVACWAVEGGLEVVLDDPEQVWRGFVAGTDGSIALRPEKGGGYSAADGRVTIGDGPCGTLLPIDGGWQVVVACSGSLRGLTWLDDRMLAPGDQGPHVVVEGQLTARDCGAGPPW